jgi:hypothetical protein
MDVSAAIVTPRAPLSRWARIMLASGLRHPPLRYATPIWLAALRDVQERMTELRHVAESDDEVGSLPVLLSGTYRQELIHASADSALFWSLDRRRSKWMLPVLGLLLTGYAAVALHRNLHYNVALVIVAVIIEFVILVGYAAILEGSRREDALLETLVRVTFLSTAVGGLLGYLVAPPLLNPVTELSKWDEWRKHGLAGSRELLVLFFLYIVFWVLSRALTGIDQFTSFRRRRECAARIETIDDLAHALTIVSVESDWHELGFRQQAIGCLERASASLEVLLADLASVVTAEGKEALSAQRRRVVGNVRALETWISTPGPQTRADLIRRLSAMLVAVIDREFDSRMIDEMDARTPREWRRRALNAGRALIGGFFPLIVTALALVSGQVDVQVLVPVLLGSSLFAGVSVLRLLDPSAVQTASEAKDRFGIFSRNP